MLYERTAISKEHDHTIRADLDQLRDEGNLSTAFAFRDSYVLDFLELQSTYSERDIESAILAELQQTLVELGIDFAFVAGRSASRSMDVTTISICCTSIGGYSLWWPST